MPSAVDICNAALVHIGEAGTVSSISPPDGSVQAAYCATYYPLALAAALEEASWGFSTTRATLAEVANPTSTWQYAYAAPNEMINAIAVLDSAALDDYSQNFGQMGGTADWANGGPSPTAGYQNPADNAYTPQPYVMETDADGNQIILTNVSNAVLRYTRMVSDPNKFSPLFVMALSYLLASMLAGPVIKGDPGSAKSKEMLALYNLYEAKAESSDASQRRVTPAQSVSWMAGR
jgi:hypothetical protein